MDPSMMQQMAMMMSAMMQKGGQKGYGKIGGGFPSPGASPYGGAMSMMKGGLLGKGGGKGGAPENETLFVKSLPLESTPEGLQAIFSQYGGVKSVKVLPPSGGRTVVAAFVIMNSVEEAKWIVENVNGQVPTGLQNPVEVIFASPREFSPTWGKGGGAKGMMMGAPQTLEAGMTGTLKAFGQKGYGYLTPDDGSEDVFFHLQAVLNGNEIDMMPGIRLKYEMGLDPASGKMKAVKVLLDTSSAASYGSAPSPASFGAASFGGAAPFGSGVPSPIGGGVPATPVEVEQFLIENPVEQHAQDKLRNLNPYVQKWVLTRGPLGFARDATGALIARIVKLEKVANGQVQVPPGDWICQSCGDHQFARNVSCRSCGAPKPDNLGIVLNAM